MSRVRDFADRVSNDRAFLDSLSHTLHLPDGSVRTAAVIGPAENDGVVVLAPTVPELGFVYAPIVRALGSKFRVVLYEPELSRTARTSLDERTDELSMVIAAVAPLGAHVIAWSDGGSAAYRLALKRSALVRSLSLVGLADEYRLPGPLNCLMVALDRLPLHLVTPPVLLRVLLSWFMGGTVVPRRWFFAESKKIPRFGMFLKQSVLPCMLEHSIQGDPLGMPSLLIGCDRDALTSQGQFERMAAGMGPLTEFRVVKGGEHMLVYSSAAEVSLILQDFLARVCRQGV